MPGSSFTTMGSDACCETCPDACYVDFNDDGIPDAEQNGTFPTNGTFRNNSINSAPVPAPVVIADTNFENGTGDPLTSSAWSPNVTAVIAQSNDSTPMMAQSGQSYLFLTFNSGSGSQQQQLLRRQSSDQPLVYNASQNFPTVAGDTYNVTAYAQQAQDGPNPPDCSIGLCVYDSCSTPALLSTGVWQQYYYLYLATYDDDSATATFSITCAGNATCLSTQQASTVVSTSLITTAIPASSFTQTLTLTATATATATLTDTRSQTTTQTATQTQTQTSITTAYIIPQLQHHPQAQWEEMHTLKYPDWKYLLIQTERTTTSTLYPATPAPITSTQYTIMTTTSTVTTTATTTQLSTVYPATPAPVAHKPSSKDALDLRIQADALSQNLHGVSRYSSACDEHADADSNRHANSNRYDNSASQYGDFSATSCHHYPDADINLYPARPNDYSDVDCDRHASSITSLTSATAPAAQLATAGSRTTTASSTTAAPTVALASPTAIFNSSQAHDDDLAWLVMPFASNLYGYNFTNVTVSVNGVLGFGITNSYSPSSLPQYSALSPSGYALMPFWADIYIYQGTAQCIYYEVDGTLPSRILTFEYYASYYQ
ncbi:hypothetical protein KCU98_g2901, partial [Aureobasidium melanogenum]